MIQFHGERTFEIVTNEKWSNKLRLAKLKWLAELQLVFGGVLLLQLCELRWIKLITNLALLRFIF